jgi:tRNA-splicing ligase RtcB
MSESIPLEQLDPFRWRIPRHGKMRVDGLIFADQILIDSIRQDKAIEQVRNVACLPGIVGHSIAMPDIHWGYGFPIGGVAAFDLDHGVVSPGGVGYDINCGVRLLTTDLMRDELEPHKHKLADALHRNIPSGVGKGRRDLQLTDRELQDLLAHGAAWAVQRGFGLPDDLEHIEERGTLAAADPALVSPRAKERGRGQLGTVGSGNHFVEVQYVDQIGDSAVAADLGLSLGTVTISIHSGSRGLGYQVCDDALAPMMEASKKYGIELPDRQLACAPIRSPEGERYLHAMCAAANFAFANRQLMAHIVRETIQSTIGLPEGRHSVRTVYDVCHNIAKIETHEIEGQARSVCVHRKGATRAFGPGDPQLSAQYRRHGQPVLIPGDMGRYSFVLVGAHSSGVAFGSCCHGAGRRLSRAAAKRAAAGRSVLAELDRAGVIVRADGLDTVVEELPEAYKDVAEVVRAVEGAGLARIVARLRPLAVIKG